VQEPPVVSDRLNLIWTGPAFMRASLDGRTAEAARLLGAMLPAVRPDDERRLKRQLQRILVDPKEAPWLGRAMLRKADGVYVGGIGFHGKPNEIGQVELGYGVEPQYRRQGYASEAAQALIDWARREHGIRRFLLSISPNNDASLGVAAKLGFQQIGTQIDEIDGEEFVFERVFEE
jgi:RimJ/RimL family protein N-acetyltransferase